MGRMSIEQKLADQVHALMMREDFTVETFALHLHRCGWILHKKLFAVFLRLIAHWAIDYDNQVTRDSDEYLALTIRARQLQDLIGKWK